jgi:hypothetical protein
MANAIIKEVLILSEQPPDELVYVAEQTVTKTANQAKLTANGYQGVLYKLQQRGFNWTADTEFHYSLYYTATGGIYSDSFSGETYRLSSGFSVIFLSQFPNGEIPAAMWIPNSWSDTPPTGGQVTIPAHDETVTPAAIITYDDNEGWNGAAACTVAVKGDGFFQFRINQENTGSVVGLNYASGATYSENYTDITHGIKTAGNQYQVVELGTTKTVAAAFLTTDVFKIVFTSLAVTYYLNGGLVYTSLSALDDKYLKLDCSLYEAGDAVYSAQFMGDNLGVYASLVALQTAYPTTTTNDYATVTGVGVYKWDGAAWTITNTELSDDLTVYLDSAEYEFIFKTGMYSEAEFIFKTGIAAESEFIFNTASLIESESEFIFNTASLIESESEFIFKTELQEYNVAENELVFLTDLRNPANTIINQIA